MGTREQEETATQLIVQPSTIHVPSFLGVQSCKGGREGDAYSNTVPTLAHCLPQQSRGRNRAHGTGQGLTPGLRAPRCAHTWLQPPLKSPSPTQQSEQTGQFCLLSGWRHRCGFGLGRHLPRHTTHPRTMTAASLLSHLQQTTMNQNTLLATPTMPCPWGGTLQWRSVLLWTQGKRWLRTGTQSSNTEADGSAAGGARPQRPPCHRSAPPGAQTGSANKHLPSEPL